MHVKDEVGHVKGAAYIRRHGCGYVVNCQREEENAQDVTLGDFFPLGKGVRESGSNPNSEGMSRKKVLNNDGNVTPQG